MSDPITPDSSWFDLARQTVEETIAALPADVQAHAARLPVSYEAQPSAELMADGIEPDTLGLFVGQAFPDELESPSPIPAQIILYVQNLKDLAEGDKEVFQTEVETTFLHELGHYLGLDEEDLADRDLD